MSTAYIMYIKKIYTPIVYKIIDSRHEICPHSAFHLFTIKYVVDKYFSNTIFILGNPKKYLSRKNNIMII